MEPSNDLALNDKIENIQTDESIPLTKPKKPKRVVTEKQLESMKAGRELLKQKRELAKAEKVVAASNVIAKHKEKSIQEQTLPIEGSISYEVKDKEKERKIKKVLPALKIPDDDESGEEVEVVYKKKPKKKVVVKYISDSESDSGSDTPPPPQKQKGLMKPERSAQNKKQLRPSGVSIFCD